MRGAARKGRPYRDPFDFDLLVKSVLDTKRNECHGETNAVRLDRKTAMKYVPHFISPKPYEPSRTVPGKFGALGSRLLKRCHLFDSGFFTEMIRGSKDWSIRVRATTTAATPAFAAARKAASVSVFATS